MNTGRTLFSQLIDDLPRHRSRACVARYRGNHRVPTFSCWDQLLTKIFPQLISRSSLRDTVACLKNITRSTLADANERHDWRIYFDFASTLIHEA